MAEPFVKLALQGATPLIQNYDTIYSKTKERIKKAGGRRDSRDQDYYEDDSFDSYNVPRRSATERVGRNGGGGYYETDRARDSRDDRDYGRPQTRDNDVEEVKRDFPPNNGSVYAAKTSRAKSVGRHGDNDDYYQSDGRPGRRDYRPRYARKYSSSSYDSESSMSPPPSRRQSSAVNKYKPRDAQSTDVATTNGTSKSNESDGNESSDVLSSSEDERLHKKMRGKAMLTASLAAVATIQAASSVYASMEARDKRHEAVLKNELSKEEAKKERNKARLQDVAAIGIAALGIKGAYAKWQGVQAEAAGVRNYKKERQERHQKRVRKGKSKTESGRRSGGGGGGDGGGGGGGGGRSRPGYDRGISYNNSEPDLHRAYRDGGRDRGRDQPKYIDGNPYNGR